MEITKHTSKLTNTESTVIKSVFSDNFFSISNCDCLDYLKSVPTKTIDLIIAEIDDIVSEDFFNELFRVNKKINMYLFCSAERVNKLNYFFIGKKYDCSVIKYDENDKSKYVLFVRDSSVKQNAFSNNAITSISYDMENRKTNEYSIIFNKKKMINFFVLNSSKTSDTVLLLSAYNTIVCDACLIVSRRFYCVEQDLLRYDKTCKSIKSKIKKLEKEHKNCSES